MSVVMSTTRDDRLVAGISSDVVYGSFREKINALTHETLVSRGGALKKLICDAGVADERVIGLYDCAGKKAELLALFGCAYFEMDENAVLVVDSVARELGHGGMLGIMYFESVGEALVATPKGVQNFYGTHDTAAPGLSWGEVLVEDFVNYINGGAAACPSH